MNTCMPWSDYMLSIGATWSSIFAMDLGRYLLGALIVTIILFVVPKGLIERRRVRMREPASSQRRHEIRHSVLTAVVFSLVGLGVFFGAEHGVLHVYSGLEARGIAYWTGSLILIVIAHDAYFYWTHRWLHQPRLFARVHRTHHVSVAPTQWAAYSFSLGEAFTQAAFLPLYLLIVPTHTAVLFLWMAHQVFRNVLGHCGVELEPRSWLATWWGRWFTTTLHHDMHHGLGRCNYGLYFTWWDRWCGTEHPEYRTRLQQLLTGAMREERS